MQKKATREPPVRQVQPVPPDHKELQARRAHKDRPVRRDPKDRLEQREPLEPRARPARRDLQA